MSKEIDFEKEMHEQASTISRLTREKHKLEKKIRGYKGLQARTDQHTEQDHPAETTDPPEKTEKIVQEPHFIGNWQKHCPTCGDTNPDFKDEIECDKDEGGCGMHLGAKDNLKNLKACPNCGGTKAKLIEKKVDN